MKVVPAICGFHVASRQLTLLILGRPTRCSRSSTRNKRPRPLSVATCWATCCNVGCGNWVKPASDIQWSWRSAWWLSHQKAWLVMPAILHGASPVHLERLWRLPKDPHQPEFHGDSAGTWNQLQIQKKPLRDHSLYWELLSVDVFCTKLADEFPFQAALAVDPRKRRSRTECPLPCKECKWMEMLWKQCTYHRISEQNSFTLRSVILSYSNRYNYVWLYEIIWLHDMFNSIQTLKLGSVVQTWQAFSTKRSAFGASFTCRNTGIVCLQSMEWKASTREFNRRI